MKTRVCLKGISFKPLSTYNCKICYNKVIPSEILLNSVHVTCNLHASVPNHKLYEHNLLVNATILRSSTITCIVFQVCQLISCKIYSHALYNTGMYYLVFQNT